MTKLWQRGRVTLTWSPDHELHGLEIVMRRRTLAEINEATLVERPDDGKSWASLTPKERVARTEANAEDLAGLIVSWNLADAAGELAPHTPAGLLANLDPSIVNEMWDAYHGLTLRVAPPLPKSSEPGPSEWDLPAQEPLDP